MKLLIDLQPLGVDADVRFLEALADDVVAERFFPVFFSRHGHGRWVGTVAAAVRRALQKHDAAQLQNCRTD